MALSRLSPCVGLRYVARILHEYLSEILVIPASLTVAAEISVGAHSVCTKPPSVWLYGR